MFRWKMCCALHRCVWVYLVYVWVCMLYMERGCARGVGVHVVCGYVHDVRGVCKWCMYVVCVHVYATLRAYRWMQVTCLRRAFVSHFLCVFAW